MIEVKGLNELKDYQNLLKVYGKLNKRRRQTWLKRKGLDLQIKLYQGFRRRKWKGGKQVALREVRKRALAGRGTLTREKTLLPQHALRAPTRSKKGRRLTKRQRLVWQEATRRTAGRGVLAVGFLTKRFRRGVMQTGPLSRYSKTNRSRQLGRMVRVNVAPDYFQITGFTPGLVEVSNRHGILSRAVAEGKADTIQYIRRKAGEDFERTMKAHGF